MKFAPIGCAVFVFASVAVIALTPRESLMSEERQTFALVAFEDGAAFVVDSRLTLEDCADARAGVAGLVCSAGVLPSHPVHVSQGACALLLEAAQRGARDGYERAESNCGAIY